MDSIRPPRFSPFYPLYFVYPTPSFPWMIKGKRDAPWWGIDLGAHSPIDKQPRDLGARFPLSPICNPYCKLSARAQELELDIGTFSSNQYKPCVESLHYHPSP